MAAIPGTSRANAFYVPNQNILVDPTKNYSRDEDFVNRLDELKALIKAEGQKVTVTLFRLHEPGNKAKARLDANGAALFEPDDGARRTLAMQQLWAEGVRMLGGREWDGTVRCELSQVDQDDPVARRISNLVSNEGREEPDRLAVARTLFELAEGISYTDDKGKKQKVPGMKPEDIALRVGYKAVDMVRDLIALHSAHKDVKTSLRAGDLNWSVIRVIVRESDQKKQLELLDAALNARKGGGNVSDVRNAIRDAKNGGKNGGDASETDTVPEIDEGPVEVTPEAEDAENRSRPVGRTAVREKIARLDKRIEQLQEQVKAKRINKAIFEAKLLELRYAKKLMNELLA